MLQKLCCLRFSALVRVAVEFPSYTVLTSLGQVVFSHYKMCPCVRDRLGFSHLLVRWPFLIAVIYASR
jgi:hypothetical protein